MPVPVFKGPKTALRRPCFYGVRPVSTGLFLRPPCFYGLRSVLSSFALREGGSESSGCAKRSRMPCPCFYEVCSIVSFKESCLGSAGAQGLTAIRSVFAIRSGSGPAVLYVSSLLAGGPPQPGKMSTGGVRIGPIRFPQFE